MARILIADERKSIRMEVRATFRMRTDWQVCGEAEDGREAMAKAAELQPDLIVLDFKMPLADGLKAGSEIGMSMPNVPIVMYTSYKTRELEVAAKMVGIRQVVGKEDGANQLLSAVEAELGAKKYHHEHRISRPFGPPTQSR
jgi:two-component system, NarL family, response regulator NreC